jgi:hypothetical protein
MSLRHARTDRLVVTYLLFILAFVMMPKGDIPETPFDEANTPTNEMVVPKAASSLEYRQCRTALVPNIFARVRRISVRRTLPICAGQLTDSRRFRELFCSFLC